MRPWSHSGTNSVSSRSSSSRTLMCRLLAQLSKRIAQRGIRDLHEPSKGLIELEDKEDRARHREGPDQERDEDGRVAGRKEAEAGEDDAEPENQYDQECGRNRATALLKQQPARLAQVECHG